MATNWHPVTPTPVRFRPTGADSKLWSGSEYIPATTAPMYEGDYTITPRGYAQTLSTEGYQLEHDIVVNPIPSNYGLVTYDGSVITVS